MTGVPGGHEFSVTNFQSQISVTNFSHGSQLTRSRIRDRFKFVTERGQSQVGIRDTPLSRIRDRFFSDGEYSVFRQEVQIVGDRRPNRSRVAAQDGERL